jgi:hypothetical protein
MTGIRRAVIAVLALTWATAGVAAEQTGTSSEQPAPGSRADLWLQEREQKARRGVAPFRQSGLERGLLWFEGRGLKVLDKTIFGFRPKVGGLPTGGGFALGTQYRLPEGTAARPNLDGSAVWSLRGYQRYEIRFGKVERDDRGALLYADLRYRNYPQEDFFGLGPDSSVRDRTNFRLRDASYDGVAGYRVARWLSGAFRFGYLQVDTGQGTDTRFPDIRARFNNATAPGLDRQPAFFRMEPSISIDTRDVPGNPHTGSSLSATFSRYEDLDANAFSFNRLALDAEQYVPLGSTARVLALHAYASGDRADRGNQIPFYLRETLGGSESLRGFREYRFRDANLLYFSGEYRWEPVRAVELALFYDAGKVFAQRSDFDFTGLRKSAGIGIRFKTPAGVVLRIDVARSSEGTRLYFKFSPAFRNLTMRVQ